MASVQKEQKEEIKKNDGIGFEKMMTYLTENINFTKDDKITPNHLNNISEFYKKEYPYYKYSTPQEIFPLLSYNKDLKQKMISFVTLRNDIISDIISQGKELLEAKVKIFNEGTIDNTFIKVVKGNKIKVPDIESDKNPHIDFSYSVLSWSCHRKKDEIMSRLIINLGMQQFYSSEIMCVKIFNTKFCIITKNGLIYILSIDDYSDSDSAQYIKDKALFVTNIFLPHCPPDLTALF